MLSCILKCFGKKLIDINKEEEVLETVERERREKSCSRAEEAALTKRVRELEEEVRRLKMKKLSAEDELKSLEVVPTPLWKVLTDAQYKDIFETHILEELDELSFRVFREVNTESRDAMRRADLEFMGTYEVSVLEGYPPVESIETRKMEGKQAQYGFCSEAAYFGNLALLRWLREEKKFDWDDRTINTAAEYGHLHIVKYCMEHKCPTKIIACAFAAERGHLDILKYLHENDAPWDWRTCFFARKNNQLECLNYAKENGCPDTN